MKIKNSVALFLVALGLGINLSFAAKDIIMEYMDGKPVTVYKITLDGEHYVVSSVSLSGNTLEELTRKVGGETSINGVFFCPSDYSGCNNQNSTVFERVYMGDPKTYSTFWPDTGVRGIFGFDKVGNPLFVQNNLSMDGLGYNTNSNKMDDLFFGLSNFPVLLIEGEDVMYRSQEFMDNKMRTRGTKTFICSSKDGNTVYMGSVGSVNLPELAPFIKRNFGCYNAINLDAGSSLAMIYDGRVISRSPRRQIMDAFVVLTREQYVDLTGIIPPEKNVPPAGSTYKLTESELDFVDKLYYKIHISSESTKKKVRITIRKMLSSDMVKLNQRAYQILKEVLIRVYTIERI